MKRAWMGAAACACLLGALFLQPSVDGCRRERGLTSGEILKSASPGQVVASSLGAFRGLAVDFLWLRSIRMQDEARFYEIDLLCRLILEMQPQFTQVWRFQAWNLSYNIAAECDTAEERWRWINSGIELLHRGLEKNSRSFALYAELGWIYYHRLSAKSGDPFWRYYRRKLDPADPRKNFRLALEAFTKAEEMPDCPPLRISRMRVHSLEALGMWKEAEDAWSGLMERRSPGEATVPTAFRKFLFGVVAHYASLGKDDDARRWYGRLRLHFPDEKRSLEELLEMLRQGA